MRVRRVALFALLLAAPTACTTRSVDTPPPSMGAQLTVERFLQASNQRDVIAMGRLFGTSDGPLGDTGSTFGCMIASILVHEDYRIVGESRVAGRVAPTQRVLVDMTTDGGTAVAGVPFVVVRTGDGRWLVEQVDLQRIMAAR